MRPASRKSGPTSYQESPSPLPSELATHIAEKRAVAELLGSAQLARAIYCSSAFLDLVAM